MIKYLICFVLLISASVSARPQQNLPPLPDNVADFYQIRVADFVTDQQTYRIFVASPRQTKTLPAVMYMTDGNRQFPMAVSQAITTITADSLPVIVGIGYPDNVAYIKARTRDYTPPASDEQFGDGGHYETFFAFIRDTVKPWVTAHYAVDEHQQIFFGHSFGGLFTLLIFQQYPETFTNYVAASPSLWWGNMQSIKPELLTRALLSHRLIITEGELERNPVKQNRRSPISREQLCNSLHTAKNNCHYILFAGKSHGSSIPDAIAVALQQTQTK